MEKQFKGKIYTWGMWMRWTRITSRWVPRWGITLLRRVPRRGITLLRRVPLLRRVCPMLWWVRPMCSISYPMSKVWKDSLVRFIMLVLTTSHIFQKLTTTIHRTRIFYNRVIRLKKKSIWKHRAGNPPIQPRPISAKVANLWLNLCQQQWN